MCVRLITSNITPNQTAALLQCWAVWGEVAPSYWLGIIDFAYDSSKFNNYTHNIWSLSRKFVWAGIQVLCGHMYVNNPIKMVMSSRWPWGKKENWGRCDACRVCCVLVWVGIHYLDLLNNMQLLSRMPCICRLSHVLSYSPWLSLSG